MNKLNYSHLSELVADFKAGAKFEVRGAAWSHFDGPVTEVYLDGRNVRARTHGADDAGLSFYSNGSGVVTKGRLVKIADAPFPTIDPSLIDPGTGSYSPPEPFLKQFVLGTPAYCPKTREVVEEVTFVKGDIRVQLLSEDGSRRISTSYNHEGKHKWIPERTLVLGELPEVEKPSPKVKTYTVDELFAWAPEGEYDMQKYGDLYKAVVCHGIGQGRSVLFCGYGRVEHLNREAWGGVQFTHVSPAIRLRLGA